MFITVSIQTYNHSETLDKTLASMQNLRCPENAEYEILVVNNNSSDHTQKVIDKYAALLSPRLRSVFEPCQGLSHARNRALKEAKGEIVCFTDDDVVVDPGWLEAVSTAFVRYSAAVVGGKSYLIYPCDKPEWLSDKDEILLSYLDYGDETLIGTDKDLFGLNYSVLKQAALDIGGFDSELGRIGKKLLSGEEKDLQERIIKNGGVVVYEPKAIVGHIVPPERLTKKWFLKRVYHGAITIRRLEKKRGGSNEVLYHLKRTIRCYLGIVKSAIMKDCDLQAFFSKQLVAIRYLGCFVEDWFSFLLGNNE